MDQCPICDGSLRDALVVCRYCGEELPLRVIVVSEGSRGQGFAVTTIEGQEESGEAQAARPDVGWEEE